MPSLAQTLSNPSHEPICALLVAVQSQPPRRKSASILCAKQKSRISSIASSELRPTRTASSAPNKLVREESLGHHDRTNPPLRPDAPPPQISCSRITTSHAGSASLIRIAVQSPTYPPPIIATSVFVCPSSGEASGASPAISSNQNERCL